MLSQRLFVIRHGETEWSRSGQHTSITDLSLTVAGEAQADTLGPKLAGEHFALVLSSPRIRALETAKRAGFAEPEITEDLCEWNYGAYEGLTTDQIRADHPGWTLFEDGVPGGETAAQVATRVDHLLDRVRASDGDVACFAHGHILRVVTARWLGFGPNDARSFALATASIGVLGYERDVPVLERWNY